ncbi:hypothetical protein CDCA_CDCA16G4266 [Cyanidium caldarium]|uniref:Uncharacterized protein n=1 Tax=Cyanidium caldarium TaxID=2771 RepID=A0AAV9J1T7_CYACA|nr:hypothetical protein CDCA_CDCA16G4266 [Cyanidium caldarium]
MFINAATPRCSGTHRAVRRSGRKHAPALLRLDATGPALSRRAFLLRTLVTTVVAGSLPWVQSVAPAAADFTPTSAKRAFDRYSSRIGQGRDLFERLARDADDHPGSRSGYDNEITKQVTNLARAMRIYAGVYSDNFESEKTKALRAKVSAMERALERAGGSPDADGRRQQLQKAREAYDAYLQDAKLSL